MQEGLETWPIMISFNVVCKQHRPVSCAATSYIWNVRARHPGWELASGHSSMADLLAHGPGESGAAIGRDHVFGNIDDMHREDVSRAAVDYRRGWRGEF